jgi:hypothetical protein
MKRELKLTLRYPTVEAALALLQPRAATRPASA